MLSATGAPGFDALLRGVGDSPLGGLHYQPVLFHEAEKVTPDLRLLLSAESGTPNCLASLARPGGCSMRPGLASLDWALVLCQCSDFGLADSCRSMIWA
jgi:hypothetical protein